VESASKRKRKDTVRRTPSQLRCHLLQLGLVRKRHCRAMASVPCFLPPHGALALRLVEMALCFLLARCFHSAQLQDVCGLATTRSGCRVPGHARAPSNTTDSCRSSLRQPDRGWSRLGRAEAVDPTVWFRAIRACRQAVTFRHLVRHLTLPPRHWTQRQPARRRCYRRSLAVQGEGCRHELVQCTLNLPHKFRLCAGESEGGLGEGIGR
jgi:hypothetical protein